MSLHLWKIFEQNETWYAFAETQWQAACLYVERNYSNNHARTVALQRIFGQPDTIAYITEAREPMVAMVPEREVE